MMSKAFILILCLLVPICSAGQALWGKTPAERSVLKHLRNIVSYVQYLRQEDENSLSVAEKDLLDSIARKTNDLLVKMPEYFQAAWQLSPPNGSEEYRRTVADYDQILLWFDSVMLVRNSARDIHLFNNISDTLRNTITFISDDVLLRLLACLSGNEFVRVNVKVTDNEGVEQPGYSVFVKPYISSDASLVIAFGAGPPAFKDIPAGWKLCWIEKDDECLQQKNWRVQANDTSTHHMVFVLQQ